MTLKLCTLLTSLPTALAAGTVWVLFWCLLLDAWFSFVFVVLGLEHQAPGLLVELSAWQTVTMLFASQKILLLLG